jgi:dipeptidyl aminopeptidase/acylaminoacyl peptidase
METRTFRASFLCLCLVALSANAFAAGFTIEQVMSSPFPTGLTAAKNGSRVAWVFNAKGERNVWVADAPDYKARQITHYTGDNGQAIASLRLTPEGKTAVFARGSETNGAGLSANPTSRTDEVTQQVFAVATDGASEPKLLGDMGCPEEDCEDIEISPDGTQAVWAAKKTLWIASVDGSKKAEQLLHLRGTMGEQKWSPDGKQLLFSLDRGDHNLIVVYDFASKSVHYMAPSVDRDGSPRWSADGKSIAFIRTPGREVKLPIIPVRPTPWSIYVADAATGVGKQIFRSGDTDKDSLPHFADESFNFAGDRIVFDWEHDGWNHLYSIPVTGGQPTLLTPGDFDVEDVEVSTDDKSVIYSSNQFGSDKNDQDRRHLWHVPIAGGKPQQLTQGETIEWSPIESGDGKALLCLGSTATSPAMPYRVTSSGREMLAKEALPADFPANELVVPKQVIFKSTDGLTIHGQLFIPKGRTQPGPALIFTHGGPPRQMMLGFHYMYYYHNAYAENQYLASKGYVVLSVNYRLGIMYGRAFRQPPNSVWRGASEYNDVVAGANYLRSLPIVDPKHIGLWGGSYGGFLTAMGLARNSDIFSAGVDFHGVHDWSMFLGEWEENPAQAPDFREALKLAFESSPNSSVDKWKSPVLLIHGDDDRNVAFNQTTDLVQRLRKQGVDFEEMIFPDEIHDFLLWKHWVDSYRATGDYFDRKLR